MLDHVVVAVREELVSLGYTVLAYNSRGVGSSTGWGSFSCALAPDCQSCRLSDAQIASRG